MITPATNDIMPQLNFVVWFSNKHAKMTRMFSNRLNDVTFNENVHDNYEWFVNKDEKQMK